jgi:ABC-2 type transport system permease protein
VTISLERAAGPLVRPQPGWRRHCRIVLHQVHYDLVTLVRNRTAQGFAIAMPVAFLVLFVAIFGNGSMHYQGQSIEGSTYYVAALSVFGIVDVAFMALLIALVEVRETGVLRRRRATPQPPWTIIASRAITTLVTGAASAALLLGIGRVAYGASLPPSALPALAVAVAAGVVTFCCLGFAVTGLVRSFQSAQPVAMALALPLTFISGVFIPWSFVPHWLQHLSTFFPVRPLAVALLNPYLAHGGRSPWDVPSLVVLGAWALAGIVVAAWGFKWAPQDI